MSDENREQSRDSNDQPVDSSDGLVESGLVEGENPTALPICPACEEGNRWDMSDDQSPRYLLEQWTTAKLIRCLQTLPDDWLWEVRVPNYTTPGYLDPTEFDLPRPTGGGDGGIEFPGQARRAS